MDKFLSQGGKSPGVSEAASSPPQKSVTSNAPFPTPNADPASAGSVAIASQGSVADPPSDIQYGFQDDNTTFPRTLRERTHGKIVSVTRVPLTSVKEEGKCYNVDFDGVPSVVLVVGKTRGDTESGVCTICWKLVTVPKSGNHSVRLKHLKQARWHSAIGPSAPRASVRKKV